MPRKPGGRYKAPIRDRRTQELRIRWLEARHAEESIKWVSCSQHVDKAFGDPPQALHTNSFYFPISEGSGNGLLLGLALLPVALAWVGPAAAYYTFGNAILSSGGIGSAIVGSISAGLLVGGLTKPSTPEFTNFNQPCPDDAGRMF